MRKPTLELWKLCEEAAAKAAGNWRFNRLDRDEKKSAAAWEFMQACQRWRRNGLGFVEWFQLRYHNRLKAMRRRLVVRHRILPRVEHPLDAVARREPPRWDIGRFMDSLDASERRLVEEVLGYDQATIQKTAKKKGDGWPVKAIMRMARGRMRAWGWDKRRMRRVIDGVREALIQSRSA